MQNNKVVNNMIKNHIESKLIRLGNFRYSYMVLNKNNPSEMIIISNYPEEWVEFYKKNNYQLVDPVVITALKNITPFSWNENLTINSRINIFNHSKKYDIVNGYTFMLHDYNNYLAMLSFMMVQDKISETEKIIEDNHDRIFMLLACVHEKFISYQKEMSPETKNESVIFSVRENEVLYWASMGKTYHEIAEILGLKESTVKFHIGNIVRKLGVSNAKHAIRLGIELQLIKPLI